MTERLVYTALCVCIVTMFISVFNLDGKHRKMASVVLFSAGAGLSQLAMWHFFHCSYSGIEYC